MNIGRFTAAMIATVAVGALAASPDNPYRVIAEKNAFRLNPPPVPVVVEPPKEEEKTNLRFTGLSWDGPNVSAWLVIDPLEPGKTSTYLSLGRGVKSEGVEVLSIDEAAQKVKVKYRNKEQDLTMATAKTAAAPGRGVRPIPGLPNVPGGRATSVIPGVNNRPSVANPRGNLPAPPSIPLRQQNNNGRSTFQRPVRTGAAGSYNSGAIANSSAIANPRVSSAPDASRPLTMPESAVAIEVQRAIQPADFPPLPPTGL